MIQFNLLPDIKLEYVRAQRAKHMLTSIALTSGGVALGLLLFAFFVVDVVQKHTLKTLDNDIHKYAQSVQSTKDLNKLLTVQNQLNALTGLHQQKPVVSRLFGYISQVTPSNVSINKLDVDYSTNVLSVGGSAPSIDAIRVYTDTLKSTQYELAHSGNKKPAFSEVVLGSFSKSDKNATFSITLKFDPALFAHSNEVTLDVVKGAKTNQGDLFNSEVGA